ncbi:MAG: response regulator [Leptolyngbya sp. LCM1.Bin17]|nr:MAG: response regulator [Leptolyngbya sp. LCM1.Bin17]
MTMKSEEPSGMLKDFQILVVDNNIDSRYLHKTLFETCGAQVTTIESIADAMTLLECFSPDILICEVRFFNEDALSLIQKIRAVEQDRENSIPILVVSAYCAAKSVQNLLAMVEGYLLKPTDIDHLVREVWNLVDQAKSTRTVNIKDWAVNHRTRTKPHAIATA